jgi:hypothetical protein
MHIQAQRVSRKVTTQLCHKSYKHYKAAYTRQRLLHNRYIPVSQSMHARSHNSLHNATTVELQHHLDKRLYVLNAMLLEAYVTKMLLCTYVSPSFKLSTLLCSPEVL